MHRQSDRLPIQIVVVLAMSSWFAVMVRLGSTDFFFTHHRVLGLSSVQQAIVAPIAFFLVTYLSVPRFAQFVRGADLTFLVSLQGIRILALSHLVSWGYGLMAGGFAFPVAIGNFVVCVLALTAVSAVAARRGHWRIRVYLVTIVGILEFLMTIALAVFGKFTHALPIDPPTAPGGYVSFGSTPLSLFPTFAIPALLIMHLVTLIVLKHQPGGIGVRRARAT